MDYVPILKWKAGERQALSKLRPVDRQRLCPLLEIPPGAVQPKAEQGRADGDPLDEDELDEPEQGSLLEGLPQDRSGALVRNVIGAWGGSAVFVDFGLLDAGWRPSSGRHPVAHFFAEARAVGQQWIPVIRTSDDDDYTAAVAGAVASGKSGVCIRAKLEEIIDDAFPGVLKRLRDRLKVAPADVDLLVDAGALPTNGLSILRAAARGALLALPTGEEWRNVIFASSSFPDTLQGVPQGTSTLPREDWRMWCSLRGVAKATRPIVLSDYTAAGTALPEGRNVGSAQIRYTIDEDWLILKGRKVTDDAHGGHEQFYGLAEELAGDPRFCKAAFSWGDNYIDACARRAVKSGNLTTWRAVATSHHIAFVLAQLGKLPPLP